MDCFVRTLAGGTGCVEGHLVRPSRSRRATRYAGRQQIAGIRLMVSAPTASRLTARLKTRATKPASAGIKQRQYARRDERNKHRRNYYCRDLSRSPPLVTHRSATTTRQTDARRHRLPHLRTRSHPHVRASALHVVSLAGSHFGSPLRPGKPVLTRGVSRRRRISGLCPCRRLTERGASAASRTRITPSCQLTPACCQGEAVHGTDQHLAV
jgi:hypothetical protein